jgi:hypothetical protein
MSGVSKRLATLYQLPAIDELDRLAERSYLLPLPGCRPARMRFFGFDARMASYSAANPMHVEPAGLTS